MLEQRFKVNNSLNRKIRIQSGGHEGRSVLDALILHKHD